jgi:hypothetical protein
LRQARPRLSRRLAPLGAHAAVGPLHALIATLACALCLAFAFLGLTRAIGLLHPAPLGVPTLHLPPLYVSTFNLAALRILFCRLCTPGALRAVLALPLRTFAHDGPPLAAALSFGRWALLALNTWFCPLAPFDARATSLLHSASRLSLRGGALAAVSFGAVLRSLAQGQRRGAEQHRQGCCWNCNPHWGNSLLCALMCSIAPQTSKPSREFR